MHETTIARSLVERVEEIARRRQLMRVEVVGIRVGVLRAVVDSTLREIYRELVAGTDLEGSRLEIAPAAMLAHCRACGAESETTRPFRLCTRCGSRKMSFTRGQELFIDYLEAEEG